jgi:N-acetylglucosaminyldiphosphoundecaprenol N-acetyl-beta-D-mannosaminyltransferase
MERVNVAGLHVDPLTKPQFLDTIVSRIKSGTKTWVVTLYSEFVLASLEQQEIKHLLNLADITVTDGIGVIVAERFLSKPLKAKNFYIKILEAWLNLKLICFKIIFAPKSLYKKIPEKIVGSDLLTDICRRAEKENLSVFFLGGFGSVPERVANKMQKKFPHLRVAGYSNAGPNSESTLNVIKQTEPDIIFVAYGPIKQERWIHTHMANLPSKLFIGVGGAFDYFVGSKLQPPKLVRKIGLEWLFRLITQPTRVVRIYRAIWVFCLSLVRIHVYSSCGFRPNVVCVVKNQEGKIFIGRKSIQDLKAFRMPEAKLHIPVWELPHGGIEAGEDIVTAGTRELMEETGMKTVKVIGVSKHTHQYEWNNAIRPLLWSKQYGINNFLAKGQKQHIVYFEFLGDDSEIKLDTREFIDGKWVNPEDLTKHILTASQAIAKLAMEDIKEGIFKEKALD